MRIPFADLPAAVGPERRGVNVFIYDSDTQDKTGQTRLGWSTWGGVQGDPYRWGRVRLDGYTPPAELADRAARGGVPARGGAVGRVVAVDRAGRPRTASPSRAARRPTTTSGSTARRGCGGARCGSACARRGVASRTCSRSTPAGRGAGLEGGRGHGRRAGDGRGALRPGRRDAREGGGRVRG